MKLKKHFWGATYIAYIRTGHYIFVWMCVKALKILKGWNLLYETYIHTWEALYEIYILESVYMYACVCVCVCVCEIPTNYNARCFQCEIYMFVWHNMMQLLHRYYWNENWWSKQICHDMSMHYNDVQEKGLHRTVAFSCIWTLCFVQYHFDCLDIFNVNGNILKHLDEFS